MNFGMESIFFLNIFGYWNRSFDSFLGDSYVMGMRCQVLVFPAACSNCHASHGASSGPVPLATLAKVTWLINVVVVEVTEFCVHAGATRTWENLVWFFKCFRLRVWRFIFRFFIDGRGFRGVWFCFSLTAICLYLILQISGYQSLMQEQ